MEESQESVVVSGPTWRAMLAFAWHGGRVAVRLVSLWLLYAFAAIGILAYVISRHLVQEDLTYIGKLTPEAFVQSFDRLMLTGLIVGVIALVVRYIFVSACDE